MEIGSLVVTVKESTVLHQTTFVKPVRPCMLQIFKRNHSLTNKVAISKNKLNKTIDEYIIALIKYIVRSFLKYILCADFIAGTTVSVNQNLFTQYQFLADLIK